MSLDFLNDEKWDFPFFKKLAANDTGAAPGHQAGLVIPKELRIFFPSLTGHPTAIEPTIDRNIRALLTVDGKEIDSVTTRYQIQTWGGTRQPESRLTGNLTSLRGQAGPRDFLIIQRNIRDLDFYRLSLVKTTNLSYKHLEDLTKGKRWGVLQGNIPVTQEDVNLSKEEESQREISTFNLFDSVTRRTETRSARLARSIVFRESVQKIYNYTCSVCGVSLKSPRGHVEIDAAHVVPRNLEGSDDARNGIALCKRHHWAFDLGLFSIDRCRKIIVPDIVINIPQNKVLSDLAGSSIREAVDERLIVHEEALQWHRENVLVAN
jgi:putative restriction endonuclease